MRNQLSHSKRASVISLLVGATVLMASAAAAQTDDARPSESSRALLILDSSNSMWGQIDGEAKVEIARRVVSDLVADWPDDATLGLMAYGHRHEGDCGDIETLAPIGPLNRGALIDAVASIRPTGKTPIAEALRQGGEALARDGAPGSAILISDGVESCGGDPCAAARALRDRGVELIVHVVGFGLDEAEADTLRCVAEETGGRYFAAADAADLSQALTSARALTTVTESDLFSDDVSVLARFEFNDSVSDSSGAGRDATLLGGRFVDGVFGRGLAVAYTGSPVGLDWSAYAPLLTPPYTIEMALTPETTDAWGKLFGFDDSVDRGWYYKNGGVQAYPYSVLGRGQVQPSVLHYIAFIVHPEDRLEVFYQGEPIGESRVSFNSPPPQAIFFYDDSPTGRREQISAVIEALRISSGAREARRT